jgi:hypothetical protein
VIPDVDDGSPVRAKQALRCSEPFTFMLIMNFARTATAVWLQRLAR